MSNIRSDDAAAPPVSLKLALYDHREALLAYVTKHMPPKLFSSFDPADVVQDVYFEALRREGEFIEVDATSRSRWLLTIARNRILYLVRRQKASKRSPQRGDDSDSLVVLLEELARYDRTPSASAASHESHFAVRESVGRLSPAHAQAIRWRFFDGLTHKEVARRTGKNENAVRQLCHYALGALRKDLAAALIAR
jgi:RNA polymerase sigma-70 factor, ECF subfamily